MKRLVTLFLVLAMLFSLASVCTAVADVEEINILKETVFSLNGANWSQGKLVLPSTAINRAYTQSPIEGMTQMTFSADFTSNGTSDWHAMMFFRDNAPGATSWEGAARPSTTRGYMLFWSLKSIAIKKIVGTSMANLAEGELSLPDDFYNGEHVYHIDLTDSEDSVAITLTIDSTLTATTVDSTDPIKEDGTITIVNHNVTGTSISISSFTANAALADSVEYFDESTLTDAGDMMMLTGDVESDATGIVFPNASGDAQIAYTSKKFLNLNAVVNLSFDISSVSAGYADWFAFINFADLTPDMAPWVPGAGMRYMVAFYANRIDLVYANGINMVTLGSYSLPDDFYTSSHKLSIMQLTDIAGVLIWLKVDDSTAIMYKDKSATAQTAPGAISVMVNDGGQVAMTMESIYTSAYVGAEADKDADAFFEENPDIQEVDFTDLLQGDEIFEDWTGSMQEPDLADNVVFYSGGKRDNIFLRGPGIATTATVNPISDTADFVFNFKAQITWGRSNTDWGGMISFRDNNAGVPLWDISSINRDRKAYSLLFSRNNNPDDSVSGSVTLNKYVEPGSGIGLAEKSGIKLQGEEITYKLGIANIDANQNGSMADEGIDYVWIVLIANGEVWINHKDFGSATAPMILDNGGITLANHFTRTLKVSGIKEGEEIEEVIIGDTGSGGNVPGGSGSDVNPDDINMNNRPGLTDDPVDSNASGCGASNKKLYLIIATLGVCMTLFGVMRGR